MSGSRDAWPKYLDRRDLLKLGAAGLAAGVTGGCVTPGTAVGMDGPSATPGGARSVLGLAHERPFADDPIDIVRVGFVGVGGMGGAHVGNFLELEGVEIVSLCDIDAPRAEEVASWITAAGRRPPSLYTRGETDFERMCGNEALDLVFTATPWEWHVPVVVAAMEADKHAATEVPAAYTVEDCWRMVEVSEQRRKHCVMMENCNYDRPELMAFHMARLGLFGEIMHAECGYLHDLRAIKFSEEGEGLWRRAHSMARNGNLYPTHGLGPVANVMDINRGDRFDYVVSMSSPTRGLQRWAREHYPEGHPKRGERYLLGDVNTTMIKTVRGRTIYVSHDTNLPRPYSRIHMVQGTQGLFQGYPHRVHIEGVSPEHGWQDWTELRPRYDHPLWTDLEERSRGAGHGGMDFIEDYRLVKCLREGLPTDMNVYDAAALSAVTPLSEWSVANRSRPVDVPDFTRGRWAQWPALGIFRA